MKIEWKREKIVKLMGVKSVCEGEKERERIAGFHLPRRHTNIVVYTLTKRHVKAKRKT